MGIAEGQPFNLEIYGDHMLKEDFSKHTTLHRCWKMMVAVHRLLHERKEERALAQVCQNLKALGSTLKAGGVWKASWDYTHLPDLQESAMGISMDEAASTARYLKEQAMLEKLLAEAREKGK